MEKLIAFNRVVCFNVLINVTGCPDVEGKPSAARLTLERVSLRAVQSLWRNDRIGHDGQYLFDELSFIYVFAAIIYINTVRSACDIMIC